MTGGWLSVISIPLGRRLYRHCKNLVSKFSLDVLIFVFAFSFHYPFNEKSFINALLKADNSITVNRIIAIGQLVVAN